jgi:hypothetical protein
MQRAHTAVYAVIALASLAFATVQPDHAVDLEHSMVSLTVGSFSGSGPVPMHTAHERAFGR